MQPPNQTERLTPEQIRSVLPDGYELIEKDRYISRADAEAALREMKFDRNVDLELTRSGVRNLNAARAMMELSALRDDPEKIPESVRKIKRENAWLFRDERAIDSGFRFLPATSEPNPDDLSDEEYYRYIEQHER